VKCYAQKPALAKDRAVSIKNNNDTNEKKLQEEKKTKIAEGEKENSRRRNGYQKGNG